MFGTKKLNKKNRFKHKKRDEKIEDLSMTDWKYWI